MLTTLAGGVIGASSAWFATSQQLRERRAERRDDRSQRRIESAASTLGKIAALLDDLDPIRFTFNMRIPESAPELQKSERERWLPLRDELAQLAVLDPSERVRKFARELQISIENVYNRLGWILHDRINPSGGDVESTMLAEAKENHTRAVEVLDEISTGLRRGYET